MEGVGEAVEVGVGVGGEVGEGGRGESGDPAVADDVDVGRGGGWPGAVGGGVVDEGGEDLLVACRAVVGGDGGVDAGEFGPAGCG